MKTKTTFILGLIATLFISQFAKAQEVTPPVAPQGQTVTVNVPGVGNVTVSIDNSGTGITIKQNNYNDPPAEDISDTEWHGHITSLGKKTCKNTDNQCLGTAGGELVEEKIDTEYHFMKLTTKNKGPMKSIGSDGYKKVDGDDIYVNDVGIMLVTRDTGVTWSIDTAGLGYMNDFAVDTAQTVWAVNSNYTALYYQYIHSNTWHKCASFPSGKAPQGFFIDKKNRYFVGTNNNGVYYSTDTGKTWTQGITGLSSVQCGQMCDDFKGNIYMLNQVGSKIYRSTDGGATWTEPPGDTCITNRLAPTSNFVTLINSITGDTLITASTQFGLYFSKDSGKTWKQVNNGIKENTLGGFWKCKTQRIVETSSNGIFWVNKNSSSWNKPIPVNGYGSAGIIYGDTIGSIYVNGISAYSAANYMKSADNGTTWQPDTAGLYQIKIGATWWVDQYGNEHNSNNDYSVGSTVYKKIGSNPYTLDTAGIGIITGLYQYVSSFGSDGAGYLYMSGYFTSKPNIMRRPILGGKWVGDTAGSGGFHFLAMAHDANHNMVGSPLYQASGLYYRNAGVWTSIPYPTNIPSYDNVSAIACDSSGGILAAFYGYDFTTNSDIGLGVYCTHDYGVSWNPIGLNKKYVNQLVNCGGDSVYALTNGYGVYAMTCSGIVNTSTKQDNSITSVPNSVKVYPNPNNGNFTLEYKLPTTSGELKIYDVTGKVVYDSKISNPEGKQTINASQLNNGIYFWQVFAGDKLIEKGKIAVVK